MYPLECTIFNVEHGFCSFVRSPGGYGLLIDCGSRARFSPAKWVNANYTTTLGRENIAYFEEKKIAEAYFTHLHLDHFDDIGSLREGVKPRHIVTDKKTIRIVEQRITEEENEHKKEVMQDFVRFTKEYSEDVETKVHWGFDCFSWRQLDFGTAAEVSASPDELINNRSFLIAVAYAGRKILFTGDMMVEGWVKALELSAMRSILHGTNFFVAAHHGHKSGFTRGILEHSGIPDLYIVSARPRDDHVAPAYSARENSSGFVVEGDIKKSRMVSTRDRGNSIRITINDDGRSSVRIIDTPDNLNENQCRLRERRTDRELKKLRLPEGVRR
jgi:beta-lactamase superfamily II metal-dependent hydrolase